MGNPTCECLIIPKATRCQERLISKTQKRDHKGCLDGRDPNEKREEREKKERGG